MPQRQASLSRRFMTVLMSVVIALVGIFAAIAITVNISRVEAQLTQRLEDAATLAAILGRVAELPTNTLAAIALAARDWTDEHLGTRHTIDTLLDTCAYPPLDVFMVTYHRDGAKSAVTLA